MSNFIQIQTVSFSCIFMYGVTSVLGGSRGFGFLEFKSVSEAQDWKEHHRVGLGYSSAD